MSHPLASTTARLLPFTATVQQHWCTLLHCRESGFAATGATYARPRLRPMDSRCGCFLPRTHFVDVILSSGDSSRISHRILYAATWAKAPKSWLPDFRSQMGVLRLSRPLSRMPPAAWSSRPTTGPCANCAGVLTPGLPLTPLRRAVGQVPAPLAASIPNTRRHLSGRQGSAAGRLVPSLVLGALLSC